MRTFHRSRGALPLSAFSALRDALLSSPLVGRSTLAGPFQSTRGFAALFRAEGKAHILHRFPSLTNHLDSVLGAPGLTAMRPWWQRKLSRIPNAWYLNVLLLTAGGTVARHVDATLRKPSGVLTAVPEMVSVLYLSVPRAKGGELVLWKGRRPIRLKPEENTVLHFRGDLPHEVLPFEPTESESIRASLVIEQYHFEPDSLRACLNSSSTHEQASPRICSTTPPDRQESSRPKADRGIARFL